jgi:hypothetical protein
MFLNIEIGGRCREVVICSGLTELTILKAELTKRVSHVANQRNMPRLRHRRHGILRCGR